MPTYEYRCKECGHELEAVQSFTDDPLTECPSCGGPLKKKFGVPGITFKGSGFYKTDSRNGKGSSSGSSTTSTGAESGSSGASDSSTNTGSSSSGSSSSSDSSGSSSSTSTGSSSGSSASASKQPAARATA